MFTQYFFSSLLCLCYATWLKNQGDICVYVQCIFPAWSCVYTGIYILKVASETVSSIINSPAHSTYVIITFKFAIVFSLCVIINKHLVLLQSTSVPASIVSVLANCREVLPISEKFPGKPVPYKDTTWRLWLL